MSPVDWLDPWYIRNPPREEQIDLDDYCSICSYLDSEHVDGRCPSEAEVRERWGK